MDTLVQTYIKDSRKNAKGINLDPINNPPVKGTGLRYAIAQGPSMVPQSKDEAVIKKAVDFNMGTLEIACELSQHYNSQLITFPELFLIGYEYSVQESQGIPVVDSALIPLAAAKYIQSHGYLDKIAEIAENRNLTIVCPMPHYGFDPKGNEGVYDVAMIFKPDGSLDKQFKNHLWGTEERMWFRIPEYPTLSHENNYQNPTNPYRAHEINGFPVGIGLCYDAEFPEVARSLALNGSLLSVFPTAAPEGILKGQTEPYPDISIHCIPANALTNLNFCSYGNRAGWEFNTKTGENSKILQYSGNSIICSPHGKALVRAVSNRDCLLIADCVIDDFPNTQPANTDYISNRRPELCSVITKMEIPFPYGKRYKYPETPRQQEEPIPPEPRN